MTDSPARSPHSEREGLDQLRADADHRLPSRSEVPSPHSEHIELQAEDLGESFRKLIESAEAYNLPDDHMVTVSLELMRHLFEQDETLREALEAIATGKVPPTYGGGAYSHRSLAREALDRVSSPASRSDDG